ncbi:DUF4330 family protein [Haloplanus natans]|uniref:DUF4330 family protein n=1 Tax=Haloplanus natans TaxID=376171 RepID=UPI0009FF9954|nr:DUF4330 family protein [Haloplanus natans]
MDLIDERGNLFGLLNVVDALVVVLVFCLVVAGVALAGEGFSGDSEPRDLPTTHVTLDLGTQPDYLLSELEENDTYSPAVNSKLTITDVHFSPQGEQTRVLLRAELRGPASGETLSYDSTPPRLGRSLSIQTDTYEVTGVIRDVGSRSTLKTREIPVVLRTESPSSGTANIAPDRPLNVGNRTVGRIDEVILYRTSDTDGRLAFISATLDVYAGATGIRFGGTRLQPGTSITFPPDTGSLSLTVLDVGSTLDQTTSDVLISSMVSSEVASRLDTGDTYRVEGRDVATVESVTVYGTDSPDQKRAFVGLNLVTIARDQTPHFGGTPVEEDSTIRFVTETYELNGEIRRVGATEQRGERTTRTVTLQLRNAPPVVANGVQEGMVERAAGSTVARITNVSRENSTIVLTSQDGGIYRREHPLNQDLTITAELTLYETPSGVSFKGRTIQQGSRIVLDLGQMTVRVTVVSL